MYRGSGPRILPIIIIIIIVALVIAALVTVGRMLFNSNKTSSNDQTTTSSVETAILDRSDTRSVRWTVRGPIVADEKFRSYQITVSPKSRTYVTYSGYLEQVIASKTYENNAKAYEQFVYALNNAGLSKTRSASNEDFRGVCATAGIAFMFETVANGTADQSEWSTTCKQSPGSMTADPLKVQALFVNQIPDFQPTFNNVY